MKKAVIDKELCVACGCCMKKCPKSAISIWHGIYAEVNETICIGCGICKKICPASIVVIKEML